MSAGPETEATIVNLKGQLDIGGCVELYERLEQAIGEGRPVRIDATAVERVDTAALQLLVAAFRECQSRGLPIAWSSTSEVLCRNAATIGLEAELALVSPTQEEPS